MPIAMTQEQQALQASLRDWTKRTNPIALARAQELHEIPPGLASLGVLAIPMDGGTAQQEAAFFAETPGQALTYQIGKTQLIGLIADAVRLRGADLDLRALHDQVWVNGNVPIALLRWELLGLTDELAALDTEAG